jgi:hypothetical protein
MIALLSCFYIGSKRAGIDAYVCQVGAASTQPNLPRT